MTLQSCFASVSIAVGKRHAAVHEIDIKPPPQQMNNALCNHLKRRHALSGFESPPPPQSSLPPTYKQSMVISTFSDRLLCQLAQIKATQPPWRARRGRHPSRSRRKASLLIELRLGTHQAGGAAAVYFTHVWAGKHELCDWLKFSSGGVLKVPLKSLWHTICLYETPSISRKLHI